MRRLSGLTLAVIALLLGAPAGASSTATPGSSRPRSSCRHPRRHFLRLRLRSLRLRRAGEDDPFDDPYVLTVIGLFLVVICLLGTLLLAHIVHSRDAVREP
jgi:hypothetical protein